MESLASTAIYLASSLTAVQAPTAIPPASPPATMSAAPVMQMGIDGGTADVLPTQNPFTLNRNRRGKSLSEAIADVVRRDALRPSTTDAESVSSFDTEQDLLDHDRVSEDVTAAHDARIAFIKRRMDEIRLEGGSAAPLFDILAAKLRFATAARHLAVARQAVGYLPTECRLERSPVSCGVGPILAAASIGPAHHGPAHRSQTPDAKSRAGALVASVHRPGSSEAQFNAARRRVRTGEGRLAAVRRDWVGRAGVGPAQAAARHSGSPQRLAAQGLGSPDHGRAAAVSSRARRLLAIARQLLEDDAGRVPHPDIKLAGLLHWDGSETWSLASYSQSAA